MSNKSSKILKLKKLLDRGEMSPDELEQLKAKLVGNKENENDQSTISTEESKTIINVPSKEKTTSSKKIQRLTYLIMAVSLAWLVTMVII